MIALILWGRGWRRDLDGWLVRARQRGDNLALIEDMFGIVEESAVAVRTKRDALTVDRNMGRARRVATETQE